MDLDHFLGEFEPQLSLGCEADLHKQWSMCEKNPGHKNLVPINQFSIKHLPEAHQTEVLYDYIKAAADLTVRVDVQNTSARRPPKFRFKLTRKKTNRIASGRVCEVNKYTEGYYVDTFGGKHLKGRQTCWCANCEDSREPSKVWWEVSVTTAAHVVFDESEAEKTSIRLFYDSDQSPVVFVNKVCVDGVNTARDWCLLKFVTCDPSLGSELELMNKRFFEARRKVFDVYKSSRDTARLAIIVSHPHGWPKCVSVGQWIEKTMDKEISYVTQFKYLTCTCPGSSGATVLALGYSWGYADPLVHSRTYQEANYSGAGEVW